jgi:hypothetical protein
MNERGYPRDRETLLREMDAGRERLERIFSSMDDGQLAALRVANGWTAKDVLAHLGAWEELNAGNLETLRSGGEPVPPVDGSADVDAVNEHFHERHREQPPEEVRRYEAEAFRRLRRALDGASDEDLFDAARFPWTRGEAYVVSVVEDSYAHWDDHVRELEAALSAIEQPTREELVRRLDDGRARLAAFIGDDDESALTAPHFGNGWSKRDLLVHLAAWEERVTRVFAAYQQGRDPAPRDTMAEEPFNAAVEAEARGLTGREAVEREAAAYAHLRRAIDAAPDGDLFDGERFRERTDGQPFVWWIVGNTFGHLDEHLGYPRG